MGETTEKRRGFTEKMNCYRLRRLKILKARCHGKKESSSRRDNIDYSSARVSRSARSLGATRKRRLAHPRQRAGGQGSRNAPVGALAISRRHQRERPQGIFVRAAGGRQGQ